MVKLTEMQNLLAEQDAIILRFTGELKKAERHLGLLVDRSKAKLEVMDQAEKGNSLMHV